MNLAGSLSIHSIDYIYCNGIVYNVEWNGLKLELNKFNNFTGPAFLRGVVHGLSWLVCGSAPRIYSVTNIKHSLYHPNQP